MFGAPVFDAAGNIYIETFSSTAGSTVYCLNQHSGTIIWQFTVDPTATVYYDTGLTIGKGLIYHGDDLELVAIGPVSPSSNGGAIAGAVIGTLLGVGLIVAGVWYWKVKLGGTLPSFGRLNLGGGSSYKAIGGSTVGSGGTGAASSTGYSYTSSL